MTRLLFVCTANICRSPMAEALFRLLAQQAGLGHKVEVDSAGISGWFRGRPPHRGTLEVLKRHGIPHSGMRSRLVRRADFEHFDLIVAMSRRQVRVLKRIAPASAHKRIRLLLGSKDVPDPYHTGRFERVYQLIKPACQRLVEELKAP